ncbi:MAG: hypothetical protein AB7F86_03780 [Bdellovibrionales bacterium]
MQKMGFCLFALTLSLLVAPVAQASTLTCRFQLEKGQMASVTLDPNSDLMNLWNGFVGGLLSLTLESKTPMVLSLPFAVNPTDPNSKLDYQKRQLIGAKVYFNQGHQSVIVRPKADGSMWIRMELPYGLFGGGTLNRRCLDKQ